MMKRKEQFIAREIAGDYVMMPVGETALKFNGLIMGNAVSAFMWENIEKVNDSDEMATLICEEFEVDFETAKKDADYLMGEMIKAGWIE